MQKKWLKFWEKIDKIKCRQIYKAAENWIAADLQSNTGIQKSMNQHLQESKENLFSLRGLKPACQSNVSVE